MWIGARSNEIAAVSTFIGLYFEEKTYADPNSVKFMYYEKATKFCKISTANLSYGVPVKSMVAISQNFVAFSEYMNFLCNFYHHKNFIYFFTLRFRNCSPSKCTKIEEYNGAYGLRERPLVMSDFRWGKRV